MQVKLRSSKHPKVSPSRARELIWTLHQCLDAATPYVPKVDAQGQPIPKVDAESGMAGTEMVTCHTPSNIVTAEILTSELPLFEALYVLIGARKEKKFSEKGKEAGKTKVRTSPQLPSPTSSSSASSSFRMHQPIRDHLNVNVTKDRNDGILCPATDTWPHGIPGLFWDQKWVRNGSKTHFSKSDLGPLGMLKQVFLARLSPW